MISEQNMTYVKNLVLGRMEKYENYVCHSNVSNNYNTNDYDIICAFNNGSTNVNGYTFRLDNAEICYIDTNSYSYNSSNHIERLKCSNGNFYKTINNFETIYTNSSDYFPSLISDIEYQENNNPVMNLDLNYFYLIILLLVIPICIYFCKYLFKVGG